MAGSDKLTHTPLAGALPEDGSICLLCAKQNITCCRTEPYLAPLCFPLSLPEWRRMKPYEHLAVLSVPGDAAYEHEEAVADQAADALFAASETAADLEAMPGPGPEASKRPQEPPERGDNICASELNVPEFINSMREMFPRDKKLINGLFPARGRHLTLRIRDDGSCIFLGAKGCRLPREVRPWYCRIFPAWVVGGSLTLFLLQDCLISHRAKGPADGLRMLGASPAHIRALYARLREDWGLGKEK